MSNSNNTTNINERQCSKCLNILPLTSEFWHRSKVHTCGFHSRCKVCVAAYLVEYLKANKKRIVIRNANAYSRDKHKAAIRNAESYKKNKEKIIIKSANYRKANKEKIAIRSAMRDAKPTKYRIYASQLQGIEETRESIKIKGVLEVKCAYCGAWFIPTRNQVNNRIGAINNTGGSRFYDSEGCKKSCPIYNKIKHPKKFKKATSREANPLLRQLVLKRDNYTCKKCGATIGDGVQLHCHHVLPATQNPMTANDPDNCTTLCKECHKGVHKIPGCGYHELRCGS